MPLWSLMYPRLQSFLYHVLVYAERADNWRWHRMPPLDNELFPERATLLREHVRHLSLQAASRAADIHEILTVCTAARNLAFYGAVDPSFIPHLDQIRPLRMCVHASDLFAGSPVFSHPLFASITYLELTDNDISAYNDESWKSLVSLPCLTHLALNYYSSVPARLLHMLLEERKLLQALILIVWEEELLELWDDVENGVSAYPTHDARFVVTVCNDFVGDWIGGAWGRAEFWTRADNFIRLKRWGKIPNVYFFADGDFADVELE
ncbi:hypothetical protein C8J57DRAFT_1502289 [Mycena rebaudengoi]|nr:hypothetical protein C8J57DRAFT_1502289 [Mycena rebaudengoi]